MSDREKRLERALRECEEYFDQRADAEYTTESPRPIANEEMGLLVTVREALVDDGAGGEQYDPYRLVLTKFPDGYLPHYCVGRTDDRKEAWVAPYWVAKKHRPTRATTAFVLATPDDRANCTIHSGHYGDSVMYTKGEKPEPSGDEDDTPPADDAPEEIADAVDDVATDLRFMTEGQIRDQLRGIAETARRKALTAPPTVPEAVEIIQGLRLEIAQVQREMERDGAMGRARMYENWKERLDKALAQHSEPEKDDENRA